jgi:hypothetical protein
MIKQHKALTIVFVLILFSISALFANASLADYGNKARFSSNLIKVKLSPQAASRSSVPAGLYAETSNFGINELDQLMSVKGGTTVIRAHRKVKNQAWADKTGWDNWFLIRLDGRSSVEETIASFKQNRYIEEATPEYFAYTTAVPNDTYYPNHWGHNNTAQLPGYTSSGHTGSGVGTPGFDSDAQMAWDLPQSYGNSNIVIAIIDSGVDTAHEDLRLVAGYDYGSGDSNPMDDAPEAGHGTCCSGIAAAKANNNLGVTGIAGGCSVMPLKIADDDGNMYFSYIENAITHAADNGAHVISMSLGATGMDQGDSPSTDDALEYAYTDGVVIFAATANDDASTIDYPSNSQYVISVGAASPSGERKSASSSDGEYWWGSNYGVNTQDARNAVDILAPTILPATDISGSAGYENGNYDLYFNGTSCATPYAAGVAALVLSVDPTLSPAEVRGVLTSTATDMTIDGGVGWDMYTGYGMVNAYNAVMSLDPSMPSVTITAPASSSTIVKNGTISVTADASDDGTIVSVDFYLDEVLQYSDTTSPYSWNWDTSTASLGSHILKAVATDNDSNVNQSTITVTLIEAADEGFETGDFSAYLWQNNSSIPWTVQSENTYSGTYAAKSGLISDNQSTQLDLTMNLSEAGDFEFYYKVSSESGWDKLFFLIDGVEQNNWSGAVDWTQASYPVSSGMHTFSWRYTKDGSDYDGSDCAWIDHINFPATAVYYAPATNFSAIPGDSSIALSWNSPGGDVQSFDIYRDSILLTNTGNTSYTDNTVTNGESYAYYVVAVYAGGESDPTEIIEVTAGIAYEAILGTGTSATGTSTGCPINIYYKSLHGQSVYTAAELNAAGIVGPINITELGFDVSGVPSLDLPNYIVRIRHTTASDVSSWQGLEDMLTVYGPVTYAPTVGWDMLTLSTPFLWNGVDNIVIDTAFDRVGSYSSSGQVKYTTVTHGYRFVRSDGSNQSSIFSGGSLASTRPNLKLTFAPLSEEPSISISVEHIDFGNVRVYETGNQNFTITNSGSGTLEGTITTSSVFSVAQTGAKAGMKAEKASSRNTINYSIEGGSSQSFTVTFTPIMPGSATGQIIITHNAEGSNKSISLEAFAYEPVPASPNPTDTATNVSINQVLGWANDGTVTAVDVYVGTDSGNLSLVAENQSDPLDSYTPASPWEYETTYYWKVVAHNASIYSGESAVFSFSTESDPTITPPFTEEFASVPPTNWSRYSGLLEEDSNLSTITSGWVSDGFANVGYSGSAKVNIYGSYAKYWLVTPPIDLGSDKAGYELSFDLALTDYGSTSLPETDGTDDKFAVVISTDNGETWSSTNTLRLWDNAGSDYVYNSISNTGENVSISLSGYSGTVKIAFYGESTINNADNDLFVDNVSVTAIPDNPIFSVSPTARDFGNLPINSTVQQAFVISNTGAGTLGISSVNLITEDSCFELIDENTYPAYLANAENLIVSVDYAPLLPGTYSATLEITDDLGSKTAHQVAITGSAYEPLSAPFVEGFETGGSDWVIVNGTQTNGWYIGEATSNTGTHSIYVSDDEGASNEYDISSYSVSHFYTDISFPESGSDFFLRFNWHANGEGGSYGNYDFLDVFLVDSGIIPVAGIQLGSASSILSEDLLGESTWQNMSLQLPADLAGTTKRLVFSWTNDGSMGTQPPAAIDNIRIVEEEDQDISVIVDGESEIVLPPVSDGENTINPSLIIDGAVGDQITFSVGYNSGVSPYANAGLDISLSGATFAGAYVIIDHNLGFVPPTLAYNAGSGWNVVYATEDWTTTTADFSVAAKGMKAGNLNIVFSASEDDTLPVELSSFSAVYLSAGSVRLNWVATTETGVLGYYVLRGETEEISEAITVSPLIEAANSSDEHSYEYLDGETLPNTTYNYWLMSRDLSGAEGFFGPVNVITNNEDEDPVPEIPTVTQNLGNYPNPFNPNTNIRYSLAEAANVKINIFNARGQLVRSLGKEHVDPGYYSLAFDGKDHSGRELSSGLYFYRFEAGKVRSTHRMMLLK